MRYFLAISLLLAAQPLAAGVLVPAVPDSFVGHWAGSPSACDSEFDDLRLHISSEHISYWESEGPILAVVVRGRELALISELSGEGRTWLATSKFTISAHGGLLSDSYSAPGQRIVRYKCPETDAVQRPNSSLKRTDQSLRD